MLSFSISRVPWRYDLRQEPDAVIPLVRIRAGGCPKGWSLPRLLRISDLPLWRLVRISIFGSWICFAGCLANKVLRQRCPHKITLRQES